MWCTKEHNKTMESHDGPYLVEQTVKWPCLIYETNNFILTLSNLGTSNTDEKFLINQGWTLKDSNGLLAFGLHTKPNPY